MKRNSTTAVPGRPLWAKLSIAVCLGLAAYWGLQSLNATAGPSKTTTAVKKKLHATPIEKIAVGHRVLGQNPEVSDDERTAFDEPNATDWKTLRLRMTKQNGGRLDITLLRPVDWIEAVGAKSGSELELDLPEMGAVGRAEVLEIGPCPPIRSGHGNVVTGTFAHESTDVIDLRVASQPAPIGCTSNHRFWSVDRREFLEAGKLQIGEHLDTPNGETTVVSLTPHAQPEPVYNIEVNGEHVYRVGEVGTLVHNSYAVNPAQLKVFTEKADDIVSTLDKLRKQIAKHGNSLDFQPILVVQDKYGNQAILDGVTRALRVHQYINRCGDVGKQITKVPVKIIVDPKADFRFLQSITDLPHW
jgi:hypothetical protein